MSVNIAFWLGVGLGVELGAIVMAGVLIGCAAREERQERSRVPKPVRPPAITPALFVHRHFDAVEDRRTAFWILSNIHGFKRGGSENRGEWYLRLGACEKRLGMPLRLLNWRKVYRKMEQENLI